MRDKDVIVSPKRMDFGPSGKKLSKSDDSAAREQEYRLLIKYYTVQGIWIREPSEETWEAYKKVSEEYKRQYDK